MTHSNIKIERLADLPFYTEGPAMDKDGNLYYTTLSGGLIWKRDKEGRNTKWAQMPCPNGQFIVYNGEHIICDSNQGTIKRFTADGVFIKDEISGQCAGTKVTTPNDLVADNMGNIFFTNSVRHVGKVFLLGASGEERILAQGLDYPNGLVLSLDQQLLYVAESFQNRILKIDLKNNHREKIKVSVLAELPRNKSGREQDNLPDGIALDCEGNLWVAHYGMQALQVLSPKGKWLLSVDTGIPLTSNLIFIDTKTLFVTGGYQEPGPGAISKISL